jgi:hypothetical protein
MQQSASKMPTGTYASPCEDGLAVHVVFRTVPRWPPPNKAEPCADIIDEAFDAISPTTPRIAYDQEGCAWVLKIWRTFFPHDELEYSKIVCVPKYL